VRGSVVVLANTAYSAPASPASPAPSAIAASFSRAGFSPMHAAASSSSRSATHARPSRDRSTAPSTAYTPPRAARHRK
jgi:hypothetical protein